MFSFANGAHEIFYFEFCVVKFSSFGLSFDGLWNKEWQEPKLGDAPTHPEVIFKDNQEPKLGDAPEGILSFVFVHR